MDIPTNLSTQAYRDIYQALRTEAVQYLNTTKEQFDQEAKRYVAWVAEGGGKYSLPVVWVQAALFVLNALEHKEVQRIIDEQESLERHNDYMAELHAINTSEFY